MDILVRTDVAPVLLTLTTDARDVVSLEAGITLLVIQSSQDTDAALLSILKSPPLYK